MRVAVAFTALLLLTAAGMGWHNRLTIALLQEEHRQLVSQLATLGITPDPAGGTGITKKPRVDRAAEARRVAVELIAYSKDMSALGAGRQSPDHALRQRMIGQMEAVTSLDAGQLKILIAEIRSAPDIEAGMRLYLLDFCLKRLAEDHPQDVLDMLTPEMLALLGGTNGAGERLRSAAVSGWALENPVAALAWYREKSGTFSDSARIPLESALISATSTTDLRLALQLVEEFGKNPMETVPSLIGRAEQDAGQKQNSLAVLRDWILTIPDGEAREKALYESLEKLILGDGNGSADFRTVTRFARNAKLTGKEMELFVRRDLLDFSYYVKPAETGRWTEWLGANFPEKDANDQIWNIFTRWSRNDYVAAGEWLTTATESPAKTTAICAYADTLAKSDPETALMWLETISASEQREESFQSLYRDWPRNDDASRNAARAFALKHGIK